MTTLLLVGSGKMGSALLQGWLDQRVQLGIHHIDIIDPHKRHPAPGSATYHALEALPGDAAPNIIIFAIKPQQLAEVLPAYKARFEKLHPLYISIAAGKNLAFYSSQLGTTAHVVRAMPNMPVVIGQGMTVLCSSKMLPPGLRQTATQLMEAVGKVEWLDEESRMDAVTALSGSGPAYVFLFMEALTRAGIKAGLPETLAKRLAVQTVSGACALAIENETIGFEQLRKDVTSPGGTTEAALKILTQGYAFERLLGDAVAAAKKRSIELK